MLAHTLATERAKDSGEDGEERMILLIALVFFTLTLEG